MHDRKHNKTLNHFEQILQQRLSRRGLLKGSLAAASARYIGVGTVTAASTVDVLAGQRTEADTTKALDSG